MNDTKKLYIATVLGLCGGDVLVRICPSHCLHWCEQSRRQRCHTYARNIHCM